MWDLILQVPVIVLFCFVSGKNTDKVIYKSRVCHTKIGIVTFLCNHSADIVDGGQFISNDIISLIRQCFCVDSGCLTLGSLL